MANAGFKYRVVNSLTGEVVSSSDEHMTLVSKKGEIVVWSVRGRKMVFGTKFNGLHVELATHKHNGEWVFQKVVKKETFSVWYKLKQIGSYFKLNKGE